MWVSIFAIFFGAGLGALLRSGFNFLTVSAVSTLPLGTFISNMVGGYFVGIAVAFLVAIPTSHQNGDFLSLLVF
uniref:Fluoride ion transporter CrcB n=1 Tax=Polynucleobacter necessarius subsp. necessarius (strain STIR1) TaxID=452638 RepID=B1XVS4_POLNS